MEFFAATWKHYQPQASPTPGLGTSEPQEAEVLSAVQAQHHEPAPAGAGLSVASAGSVGGREQLAKAFTRSRL